jgi:hypothetical protein
MDAPPSTDSLLDLRRVLDGRGALSSVDLQRALGLSQPSVSRLLSSAATQVLVLGRGRATRYALPHGIGGAAAEQPLTWIDEHGTAHPFACLAFGSGGWVHVHAGKTLLHTAGALPWFLAPLQAEGFLGRALARQLAPQGLPADPAAWSIEQVLLAALHTPDAPGALRLGDTAAALPASMPTLEALDEAGRTALLDKLADQAAQSLPAGSSAGGEQAKFLLRDQDGHPLIAKFSPPRGTPFGDRWGDLLHAEAIALSLLGAHGVPVADTRVVTTARRTVLLSRRFDRVGRRGRRHVVPLWAAHEAFVPGPKRHWAATCDGLEARRRLPTGSAARAQALLQFGRLIGNTDMHFGNLGLWVEREQIFAGRFRLAPLYDMLPMRWRPDGSSGELGLLPFEPDASDLQSSARSLAIEYWSRVAESPPISRGFRKLAGEQARLCG